jgi:uncharacterized protein YjbI with pentapeptide repeats
MTVRNWLELLIVPLALAGIGFWFTMQQDARQAVLEEQRAQDAALQAYLDQMNTLLLEHDLRNSEEDSEVHTLARARTLTVLGRLDPSRKTEVMQFLVEARLVQTVDERDPIIRLSGANLSDADLYGADLRDAYLVGADLSGADLGQAELNDANLGVADLSSANLSWAKLSGAVLFGADLRGANLSDAYLSDANLLEADMSGADLRNAKGVTNEQLEQQARSLEGATIPNGSQHP